MDIPHKLTHTPCEYSQAQPSLSCSIMSSIQGINHVEYVGIIDLIKDHKPQLTCQEHMLRDLPCVLQSPNGKLSPKIPHIVSECARIAQDRLSRLPPERQLPFNEALAVVSYTYDLGLQSEEDGADNLYMVLNEKLRMRNGVTMRKLKPYLTYLMRGIHALPKAQGTYYRGVPKKCLTVVQEKYMEGCHVHWSAFTSCTSDIDVAKNFADQGGVIFRITVRNARNVCAYSAYVQENEVLLSPNIKLFVKSQATLEEDGWYYVCLTEQRQPEEMVIF
jgi:hypothetical protein